MAIVWAFDNVPELLEYYEDCPQCQGRGCYSVPSYAEEKFFGNEQQQCNCETVIRPFPLVVPKKYEELTLDPECENRELWYTILSYRNYYLSKLRHKIEEFYTECMNDPKEIPKEIFKSIGLLWTKREKPEWLNL